MYVVVAKNNLVAQRCCVCGVRTDSPRPGSARPCERNANDPHVEFKCHGEDDQLVDEKAR